MSDTILKLTDLMVLFSISELDPDPIWDIEELIAEEAEAHDHWPLSGDEPTDAEAMYCLQLYALAATYAITTIDPE